MAPGTETVHLKTLNPYGSIPVWQMFYYGGMVEPYWQNRAIAEPTYRVLKDALSHPPADAPWRGPHFSAIKDIGSYAATWTGDIHLFNGHESINLEPDFLQDTLDHDYGRKIIQPGRKNLTFKQYFGGGIIIYDHAKI